MKKKYQSPFAETFRFQTEDILSVSVPILIRPGESTGLGGKEDETELLPNSNVNGFR